MVLRAATLMSLIVLAQGSPDDLNQQDRLKLEKALEAFGMNGEYRVRHPDHWVVRVPAMEGGACDLTFDDDFNLIESDCP